MDGQRNNHPTTSYAAPEIESLTLLGFGSIDSLSGAGGQRILITGKNFGPPEDSEDEPTLLTRISFGPETYTEYVVKDFTVASHTEASFVLPPGVGSDLRVIVTVADQVSRPSVATMSYGLPVITSVTPSTAPTNPENLLATIKGKNLGALFSKSQVTITVGNEDDRTTSQPISPATMSHNPTTLVDTLTFYVPQGLGAARSVRVRVVSQGLSVVSPPCTQNCVISYDAPTVENIDRTVVVVAADKAAALQMMGLEANSTSPVMRVDISGSK